MEKQNGTEKGNENRTKMALAMKEFEVGESFRELLERNPDLFELMFSMRPQTELWEPPSHTPPDVVAQMPDMEAAEAWLAGIAPATCHNNRSLGIGLVNVIRKQTYNWAVKKGSVQGESIKGWNWKEHIKSIQDEEG